MVLDNLQYRVIVARWMFRWAKASKVRVQDTLTGWNLGAPKFWLVSATRKPTWNPEGCSHRRARPFEKNLHWVVLALGQALNMHDIIFKPPTACQCQVRFLMLVDYNLVLARSKLPTLLPPPVLVSPRVPSPSPSRILICLENVKSFFCATLPPIRCHFWLSCPNLTSLEALRG